MTRSEAHKIYANAFWLLALVVAMGLAIRTGIDNLPDPVDTSCTCAGKPQGCRTQVFEVDRGQRAYCALWEGPKGSKQSCCRIVGEAS